MAIDDSHMKPYVCRRCGPNVEYYKWRKKGSLLRRCKKCNKGDERARSGRKARFKLDDIDIDKLCVLYLSGKTPKFIGSVFGCSKKCIINALRKRGVKLRGYSEAHRIRGRNNRRERIINYAGYYEVGIYPEDPYYDMANARGNRRILRYVREHRYITAKHLGRSLGSWEIVHHINHNRLDNRIENLELISRSVEHLGETFAHKEFLKMKKRIQDLENQLTQRKEAHA